MIVATENLSKDYDGVYRVQGLDIRIKEGDIYGFLSPNGAGKSTTMKMLLGLVKPTSFAVPVGLAVCLSIAGLGFHIAGLSSMFPYSQIILGLSSQDEVLPIDSIATLVPMIVIYTAVFVVLAASRLKKTDIVAG